VRFIPPSETLGPPVLPLQRSQLVLWRLGSGGEYRTGAAHVEAACLRCPETPCARYSSDERGRHGHVPEHVCAVDALQNTAVGVVVTDACFGCGLCVVRCSWGAIRFKQARATVVQPAEEYGEVDPAEHARERDRLKREREWLDSDTEPFLAAVWSALARLRQVPFYEFVCSLLTALGVPANASRHGDTSLRMDAVCPDPKASMPVEIKSPTETPSADLKAVRQALENAVIMRARETDPTEPTTPSLAIGFERVPQRSDARELADDIETTYGIRVRLLSTERLLEVLVSTTLGDVGLDADALRRGDISD